MSTENLTPESNITEIFEAIMPEEGMRCVPTQVPAPEGKAHLAILITGTEAEANVLMANLMAYVTDMYEIAQQKEADDGPAIVDQSGEVIDGEPSIVLPSANA